MRNLFSKISLLESNLAIAFFVAFCIYFIPSANHEIRVHDVFDGNFSTRHVLIHSGHFFDANPNQTVPGIMNGLPRGVFPRFTEITSLLMYFFGSLNGYALTFLIVRLLAFFGLFLFGKDHLSIPQNQKGLLVLVSVAFACLPFFVIHGLTVAGIPLLIWAFFNIAKKQNIGLSYFVLTLFVLWSNFVLVGVHILLFLGILALYFSFKQKKIHFQLFLATAFILVLYILSDYMLFYMHSLNTNYQSSRGEMDKLLGLNLKGVIGGAFKSLFTGDYSTANYFGYLFVPVLTYFTWFWLKNKNQDWVKLATMFFLFSLLCALFINLLDWKQFAFFYEKVSFAKVFNFKRFTSVLPGFFFITMLIMILIMNQKESMLLRVFTGMPILFLFVFLWRGNISYNRSAFNTNGLKIITEQQITFDDFFDTGFYKRIKQEIGVDTINNVIHFGLSPSASKYAGLPVLDDYQGDYPKKYKTLFRSVIAGELEKSQKLKTYFDNWGSRCYLESAKTFENILEQKLGYAYEPDLSINTQQLKALNCKYIISSIIIGNASKLNLHPKKVLVSYKNNKVVILYKLI